MTPDRHLGAAWVSCCRPDILITESTYATTIRDSKRTREREFLEKIHARIKAGGKVHNLILLYDYLGFDSSVCFGKSPGALHFIRNLLGKNES